MPQEDNAQAEEAAAAAAAQEAPGGGTLEERGPDAAPQPRAAWAAAAGAASATPAVPDAALAAAYLRRLGLDEAAAEGLASGEPFKGFGAAPKTLLCDLLQRHVLRVPFENLEHHQAVPSGSPSHEEACIRRLQNPRLAAERIALGWVGGLCFDLNPAFLWLLRKLGAPARLAAAWAAGPGGYAPSPSHMVILVDLPDGTFLVDPGFADPPRTAIRIDGETADDQATYEVATLDEGDRPAVGFDKVLRRTRAAHSLCRHVMRPDDVALDGAEADAAALFAFRSADNLASDAEELRKGVRDALSSSLAERRLVCLALPRGHIVLSESRSRRVEGGVVVEEVEVDSQATWQKLAGAILGRPLLDGQLRVGKALTMERKSLSVQEGVGKSLESKEAAASKAKNWGLINNSSIAVGGAGSGGGMGLNAPGFGPKVQHFAGNSRSGTDKMRSINVDEEIKKAWAQVMDDTDPLAWVFCEYSTDGKGLLLTSKGEGGLKVFKEQLGTSMGWGGFRCCGVDKRGGVECKRPKFIFVQYKPESAPAIKKAKQGSHKGDVKDAITGAHIDVTVENAAQDLDEQALITKLQAATGAHKPNGYEFEEGVFLEADFYGLGIGRDCKGENSRN